MLPDNLKAYEYWWSQTTRDRKSGLLHGPVAGGLDDEAEFISWSSPLEAVVVEFAAGCLGGYPTVPAASPPKDSRYVLLDQRVTPVTPVSLNNGEFAYFIAGRYVYGRRRAGSVDEAAPFVHLAPDFGGGVGQHAAEFAAIAFKQLSPFLNGTVAPPPPPPATQYPLYPRP